MPGYGFGFSRSPRRTGMATGGNPPPTTLEITIGALTRNQFGAGVPVSGSTIVSGDAGGHWTVSQGRLFPSASGDAADLNAGPYALQMDDGSTVNVTIEPDTWDVTDQSEWNAVAVQSEAVLKGKTIALRNTGTINLGITAAIGTPLRRVDLRDGANKPLTVKGRLGAPGDWASYCEIDKVQALRGTRGVTFRHLRTTPVAESKFAFIGESTRPVEDIIIEDCWITGEPDDPNGDFAISGNYANFNVDLIKTQGSATGSIGNITVRDCLIEWGDSLINVICDRAGHQSTIVGNECRYFYGDAIAVSIATAAPVPTSITDNFVHSSVGLSSDSANPHVDAIRLLGNANAQTDWAGIVIERNICLQGASRGEMQCIFIDDMKTQAADSGRFFTATVRNNIVSVSTAPHGIWVVQAKNCLIEDNTVVSYARGSANAPSILIGPATATGTSGGGNLVRRCIADSIGGDVVQTGNFVAGLNGSLIDYAELLDGPGFAPTTTEEAKTMLNPKVAAGALIA